ncbi:MAG: cupredoxin domain-containing protein, partial [Actinomycetota bacterium]
MIVIAVAVGVAAFGAWFFFGPRKMHLAELADGMQSADIVVQGAYAPNILRVRQGVPLKITFDRREGGECTSQVVFSDLRKSFDLPAFKRTTVTIVPDRVGEIRFACGMNMVHGKLIVEPEDAGSAGEDGHHIHGTDVAVETPLSEDTNRDEPRNDDTL